MARVKSFVRMFQLAERDTKPPEPVMRDCTDDVLGSRKPSRDPAVLEAADRFERIMAKKEAIKNGMKWMENEVLHAFESAGYQLLAFQLEEPAKADTNIPLDLSVSMYEFVNLDKQCLIYDPLSVSYHHYNFTMAKKSSRKHYELFFAEVKSTKEGKQYFCCPLQSCRCFGCENVGIDLKHPTAGKYEKGNEHSGFLFDSDSGGDD
ncbi:hypothetical protein PR202_gb24302 [Eleusine coracana subsp. coracana]|uniref:DUF3615 domain-containing protein n=1 Tax=Eleusine coracana subsp. coracana TaxID=191504 RepID=A0AAV5FLP1_ELECO|nr:hypothetical protein PR202_gb24302 [Eleusine coracana subsp. coracana]